VPVQCDDWRLCGDDFVRADRRIINAQVATEKWTSIVMSLLDEDNCARH
jgi:hypothetical protein